MTTPSPPVPQRLRRLVLVLGDQLDAGSAVFDGFDPEHDAAWMAEVAEESSHVPSIKPRTAVFLAAMRHFRDELRSSGRPVIYRELDDDEDGGLVAVLERTVRAHQPESLHVVHPGEHRLLVGLKEAASRLDLPLTIHDDRHFYTTLEEFDAHADGRKQLRLEYFYRELRRRHDILLDGREPVGGSWNYDADNRRSFRRGGPTGLQEPLPFAPDATTKEVLALVDRELGDRAGDLSRFDWPVTRAQAKEALDDFIRHRLPLFGDYQDAMWTDQPWLYHSRLSAAINLKLLDPREVVDAAVDAHADGMAPLNAVEGFVRQILGWREFVRGVYWRFMPEYVERNHLGATLPLPHLYWTAETDMRCLQQAVGQTLELGYAHHVQRLMITGLFAMLFGADPRVVHEWYLSVYVDAIEWVELPNVLGMSQFADGGLMTSKPYCASGAYIKRMSNYCGSCRFNPSRATGDDACPFTTLYWSFLAKHREELKKNHRLGMQLKNLDRKSAGELRAIRKQAETLQRDLTS
ncbi:MAG: cryptochrome/photolyase family protein [Acidobacteriota bacterium]